MKNAPKVLTQKELILLGMVGSMLEQDSGRWKTLRERILDAGYEWQVTSFTLFFESGEITDDDIADTIFEIGMDILGDNEQED